MSFTFNPPIEPKVKYGTVEYYKESFSDILCDLGDTPSVHEEDLMENTIKGLLEALDSWFEYHDEAAKRYATARERVRQALTV